MSSITFTTLHTAQGSKARAGILTTPHGEVHTPMFVPVGTKATVKSLTPQDLTTLGVEILFGNTYHLHLRPGEQIIKEFGGLAAFMGWKGVTMTDSGGFQVFSLAKERTFGEKENISQLSTPLVTITEEGVVFRSYLDGSKHFFTPEESISIQKQIGADIILAFDQCTTYPITYESALQDMERTHRWAKRSLEAFAKPEKFSQSLYGIVQGSIFQKLREESAQYISSLPFDGYAVGGVSVGESKEEMKNVVSWTVPYLPSDKVRHLLGVGDIDDIFTIIELGIDTFDCVTPTRLGRVGVAFVHPGEGNKKNKFRIDIVKSSYAKSKDPLSFDCTCMVCKQFTRGYIHHLFRANELLGYRLVTFHNLFFILELVRSIRESILSDSFYDLKKKWLSE